MMSAELLKPYHPALTLSCPTPWPMDYYLNIILMIKSTILAQKLKKFSHNLKMIALYDPFKP